MIIGDFTQFALQCDFTNCTTSIISNIMCSHDELHNTSKVSVFDLANHYVSLTTWETTIIKNLRMV